MRNDCINGIIELLHEEVVTNLERDNIAYKEYLQEESELINCIANLNISEVTRDYLNDKYYTLVSRLDYLMFVAGLRASKEITGILHDDNLDKVLIQGGQQLDIIKSLKREDIPDKYQGIIDIIGKEKFIELLDREGGKKIYLPQKESFKLNIISRLVYEEYIGGCGVADLADKYMLDVRTVRKYIKKHAKEA